MESNFTIDSLPPHSKEAEQGVLGCILLCPMDTMNECAQKLVLGGNEFYELQHQIIYKTLIAMWQDRLLIDLITVQQRLKDRKRLDQIGGIEYLSKLQDSVPSAANIGYYIEIVQDKAMASELLAVSGKRSAAAHKSDIQKSITEAEMAVLGIRQRREGGRGASDIKTIQDALICDYEDAANGNRKMGILTGFPALDDMMGGMMEQEVIILAASPSAGKTTLMLNILFNVAEAGTPVGIISMETSSKKIIHRLHCMAGQVEGGLFYRGAASKQDLERMAMAAARVGRSRHKIHLRDDVRGDTGLVSCCRQMYQAGARIIGIDYLQLLSTPDYEGVSQSSSTVKGIAKELNIPVILISSLNRGTNNQNKDGKDKKPTMSDLRGSGSIEFDADKIGLLYCPDRESAVRSVEFNLAKNKDGMCGRKELTMFASQFRFQSGMPVDAADIPTGHND